MGRARSVVADVCVLAGAGLVLLGLWWLNPPASLIGAGLLLVLVGWRMNPS